VLARVARENGALVLAIVALPFDFEGRRRQQQAQAALKQLKTVADAVISLPNQKVAGLIDEKTSLSEAMLIVDDLLARGVRGLLRLMTRDGLISVDFSDLCHVVRGRQAESCFATTEATGENRAREVVERLVASPLLDNGRALSGADAVLVSLTGGPGLSLREVNQVMEQINRLCEHAQVVMGATVDPELEGRLAVTLIAAGRPAAEASVPAVRARDGLAGVEPEPPASEFPTGESTPAAERGEAGAGPRPTQRYVPPPPELTAEQAARILAGRTGGGMRRRTRVKPQQGMLPLEAVSKGRFAKSEPTIHRGEDLDTPTYIRRGMALN
jgi:cell division protein FtsZ